jgi:hypothetical protein
MHHHLEALCRFLVKETSSIDGAAFITVDSEMSASQNLFCSYVQAFHSQENQYYADYDKKYYILY